MVQGLWFVGFEIGGTYPDGQGGDPTMEVPRPQPRAAAGGRLGVCLYVSGLACENARCRGEVFRGVVGGGMGECMGDEGVVVR